MVVVDGGDGADMEIMYAVVRPPTAPAPVVRVEMNEVVARRYLATRYFEEIINRRQIHRTPHAARRTRTRHTPHATRHAQHDTRLRVVVGGGAVIEELFTADCVVHGGLAANGEAALGPLHGLEGVYTHVSALLTAFPRYCAPPHPPPPPPPSPSRACLAHRTRASPHTPTARTACVSFARA
jgi:hypothetical protein